MSARESGADSADSGGGGGGGGGAGFGGFLLGLAVGAAIGFLFAPEAGSGSRRRLAGKLRELRDLAADKAGQLGELVDEARADTEAVSAARAGKKRPGLDARRPPPAPRAARPRGGAGRGGAAGPPGGGCGCSCGSRPACSEACGRPSTRCSTPTRSAPGPLPSSST